MKISTRRICGASIAALLAFSPMAASAQAIQYRDADNINNVNVSVAQPLPVTVSGGGSNAAASATGSAVPANGSYNALNVGGTLRGQTGTNTSGSVYAGDVNVVNEADGANATLGAKADSACASDNGTCSISALVKRTNQNVTTLNTTAQTGTGATASSVPASAVLMGGRAATAAPTAVTDGQLVAPMMGAEGKQVVLPYSIKELAVRGTTTSTDTSAHTIIASAGGSLKNYITALQCGRTDAGATAIVLTLSDAASTVVILPSGGATNIQFPIPLATAAATAFQVTSGTGVSTLYCSAQGYTGL